MATLFDRATFAIWCQTTIAADDAFATMCMQRATELVVDEANAPGWELNPATAPRKAVLIALRVARRTYLNPDQEVASSVGPLSSRVLDDAAAGMTLTDAEKEELAALDPAGNSSVPQLWVQKTTRGTQEELPLVFLPTERGDLIPYAYEGETTAFDVLP